MIDINDPQLTAYALGELEGTEAEMMKRQIENDPAAQKYVEEIQATARLIETDLKQESIPRLEVAERERIFAKTQPRKSLFLWKIGGGVLAAAAASLIAFVVLVPQKTVDQHLADLSNPMLVGQPQIAKNEFEIPEPYSASQPPQTSEGAGEIGSAGSKGSAVKDGQDPAMKPYTFQDQISAPKQEESLTETSAPAELSKDMGMAPSASARAGSPVKMMARAERKKIGYGSGGGKMFIDAEQVEGDQFNTESYGRIVDNVFKAVKNDALSTFSTDVDTASYANARRFLVGGTLPPKDAVRTEEFLNYFKYDYPAPTGNQPFSVTTEVSQAPWKTDHQLVRIGLKGKVFPQAERKNSNLVFLLDVSGSMQDENKLPLLQKSLKLLTETLTAKDSVSIVVYAGDTGVVLPSTSGKDHAKIINAIDELRAGGGTNGASGIELAYKEAQKNMIKGGINRVILATDGDFNIGNTSEGDLTRMIEEKAKTGVFLSILGFGMGNYKDSTMQKLANKGNGNHAYIDSLREARKVLVEQAGGTFNTIAKDVKIQVEFNPKFVSEFRLIGYEKRILNHEDFNDDKKDAGEIGEGHTVTALYEIIPVGVKSGKAGSVDALKYQKSAAEVSAKANPALDQEMMTVKLRYKKPDGDKSELIEKSVPSEKKNFAEASSDMKFAASVAGFAMLLRDSEFKNDLTFKKVEEIAAANTKNDEYRKEFVELVKKAGSLQKSK